MLEAQLLQLPMRRLVERRGRRLAGPPRFAGHGPAAAEGSAGLVPRRYRDRWKLPKAYVWETIC